MINIHEMTVLLVDDMPNMLKSIRGMLKILGYGKIFLTASNGVEALRMLEKEPVDLVILDNDMPVMSGAELLREIRDNRKLRDLPVIMVTAQAYRDFVAEAGESTVGAYILKPITVKVLDEKISSVVSDANHPPPMAWHLKMAREFEEKGDIERAIAQAKQAMEANPKATRPIRELGYYHLKNNDLKEAEKWLLKATQLNTLDVFAFHQLGELYLSLDDIEKASIYYEKAMRISPRHLSRGLNFGKTLVARNMANKAISVFEKTFELSEKPLQLKEEIADFLIESGSHEYAVKLLEDILNEEPDRTELFFRLALSLEKLSDLKKAVNYLVQAEAADKENVEIKLHLARNYLSLKKPIMAERPLREVLKANPENTLAVELLKQCT
ncbi:MAG: response regulator [Pseudomonadota bacterium]